MRAAAILLAAAFAVTAASSARAQNYPARPIHLVVPYPAGGGTDFFARLVGGKMSELIGQPVVIENKPGAATNLGADSVAKAAPDGYTILLGDVATYAANPSLYKKMPFDPDKDFAPISLLCSSPHLLTVHPSVPAQSVNELIALAKASPGKFSFASAGRGTPAHLAGELFKLTFGLDITHVPFNGGGPATAATVGGHVPIGVPALPTGVTYVRGGNLRALALFSSKRASALPEVPTMAEASGHDLPADIINGFVVPSGTPKPVIDLLYREVIKVMAMPDTREKLAGMGFDPVGSTPEEFDVWMRRELTRWGQVIRDANISMQ
jgi:tripartite-type tricarboxylate transporter receptor subunit TctC